MLQMARAWTPTRGHSIGGHAMAATVFTMEIHILQLLRVRVPLPTDNGRAQILSRMAIARVALLKDRSLPS